MSEVQQPKVEEEVQEKDVIGYGQACQILIISIFLLLFGLLFLNNSTNKVNYGGNQCDILQKWTFSFAIFALISAGLLFVVGMPFCTMISGLEKVEVRDLQGCKQIYKYIFYFIQILIYPFLFLYSIGLVVAYEEEERCGQLRDLTMAYLIIFWSLFSIIAIIMVFYTFMYAAKVLLQEKQEYKYQLAKVLLPNQIKLKQNRQNNPNSGVGVSTIQNKPIPEYILPQNQQEIKLDNQNKAPSPKESVILVSVQK